MSSKPNGGKTEVDRTTYEMLVLRRVVQLLALGLDYIAAKQQALEEAERVFVCRQWAMQDEFQKDHDESKETGGGPGA